MTTLKDKEDQNLPQTLKNIITLFGCTPDNFKIGDDIYSKISEVTGIARKEVKRKWLSILYGAY